MGMRDTIIAYVTALASSGAVFRFGYDLPSPLAAFMAAVAALVGLAAVYGLTKAWAWSRPVRAAWHRQRARALADELGLSQGEAVALLLAAGWPS